MCDTAGYAPFGFGYRRCPGEFLTLNFIKDVLRKVWRDHIESRPSPYRKRRCSRSGP